MNKKAEIFLSPKGIPFIVAWESFDTLRQVGIIDIAVQNKIEEVKNI